MNIPGKAKHCPVCHRWCLQYYIGQTTFFELKVILDFYACGNCGASWSNYANGSVKGIQGSENLV